MYSRQAISALCVLMFLIFVTVDFITPQRLVMAILLNIPVALSGLVFSRKLTVGLVVGALVTNVFTAWSNASTEGGLDAISFGNRALLTVSFALVGWMTIALTNTSSRLDVVRLEESQARQERDRERVIAAVNLQDSLASALMIVAESLTGVLNAQAVVLIRLNEQKFGELRAAYPSAVTSWACGSAITRAVQKKLQNESHDQTSTNITFTDRPDLYGLLADHALITSLNWPGRAPLLLAVLDPNPQNKELLTEFCGPLTTALERVELNQQLKDNRIELERRSGVIRDLVYAFSHDLRTPLVANGVNMRLALEGAFGPLSEEFQRSLEHGMEANEDLLKLADTLLLLARYESGDVRKPEENIDLEREAKAVAVRLENPMQLRNIQLIWQIETHAAETHVRGSSPDLRRVLQNLLENAVKHSPANSSIEVRIEYKNAVLRLEVADRGLGVNQELEPRLFSRFAGGKAGGGSGLGLYLSRRIVETHRGKIGYLPRQNGGSVFWLELPIGIMHA